MCTPWTLVACTLRAHYAQAARTPQRALGCVSRHVTTCTSCVAGYVTRCVTPCPNAWACCVAAPCCDTKNRVVIPLMPRTLRVRCVLCCARCRACRNAPEPYRRALLCCIAAQRSPPVTIQKLYRNLEPMPRALSCVVALYCRPLSRYKILHHDTPLVARPCVGAAARPCALAAACPCARAAARPCARAGRVMARCWPYCRALGCRVAVPAARPNPTLCHDTICCIVTQIGKWAVAHPISCTFFPPFFPLFQLL